MSDTNKKPDNPLNVDGVGESQEARQADLAPETHNDEQGRVDMGAYRGEPNHDDNVDKYGKGHKPDGLRGDGT